VIACRTLGPLAIEVDGAAPPPELLWRKHAALLVYLARSPRRTRSREQLIGMLWGDRRESAARHSLREAVHILRRCAGEAGVDAAGEQIRLAEGAVDLDVDRLETLAARSDWERAAALVAGRFLEGFSVPDAPDFEDWMAAERLAWTRRCVEVLAARARELERAGHPTDAAGVAQRALALDPLSDTAALAAIHAYALAGERGVALDAFDRYAARLADQVGGVPSDPLRSLAERVRSERIWHLPAGLEPERLRGAESRRAPLVGRARELATALDLLDACRARPCATALFVHGDAGLGKTRLAEEVLAHARLAGASTAQARAVQADTDEPWSGALGLAAGGLLGAPGLAGASPEALAAFAARLPEWGDRFPDARRADALPLGQALTDILRAATAEQPLALLLDDAQWSDRDSLLALDAALRALPRSPLLVVFAAAPVPDREELDGIGARVPRDLAGAGVSLDALSLEELRPLVAWAMPTYTEEQRDRLVRRLAADSAGLPLLAVELLHAVALGLDLQGTAIAWPEPHRTLDQTLPGDLPDGVVAALRIGYRRLSRDAQTILAAASVLGDRVEPARLARATGLDPTRAASALDELEWQRWLTCESRGYSFVARIVREVIARDMLTEGQRQRIHAAAGAAAGRGEAPARPGT
jgi:DNA-binding SARP family transcriptional activator